MPSQSRLLLVEVWSLPLLAISRTGIYNDCLAPRTDQKRLDRCNDGITDWVIKLRRKPIELRRDVSRRRIGKHLERLKKRILEFHDAVDSNGTDLEPCTRRIGWGVHP